MSFNPVLTPAQQIPAPESLCATLANALGAKAKHVGLAPRSSRLPL
jgi:hypothetical protein